MKFKPILLAGASASGKSTLARALSGGGRGFAASTSEYLRTFTGSSSPQVLLKTGDALDLEDPGWVYRLSQRWGDSLVVVDAIRSDAQLRSFRGSGFVLVNVNCDPWELNRRHRARGTDPATFRTYQFKDPDITWDSTRSGLSHALAMIEAAAGVGFADVVVGAQYGSEGKGKLCAHLAGNYDVLLRSGGPNAGHWVRSEAYNYCFHQIPSGSRENPAASIFIAAGATLNPGNLMQEIQETDTGDRLQIDPNAVVIEDRDRETEGKLVDLVGSTAQGVGAATSRRILRGFRDPVRTFADLAMEDSKWGPWISLRTISERLHDEMNGGRKVLVEGTQGSALSLYHGPYPYTTSRDTNVGGLLAETGIAPYRVRDTWLVVRPFPIRVGGNSGPMRLETTWEQVARNVGLDPQVVKERELTSTTKRQRRVGQFDEVQFAQAVALNRPTRLFLTFADYLAPVGGTDKWSDLPPEVLSFVAQLENLAGCPVAGVSTGRNQSETAWRAGYDPASEKQ